MKKHTATQRRVSSVIAALALVSGETPRTVRAWHNVLAGNSDLQAQHVQDVLRCLTFFAVPVATRPQEPLHIWAIGLPANLTFLVRCGAHYRVIRGRTATCLLHPKGIELGGWVTDQVDEAWLVLKTDLPRSKPGQGDPFGQRLKARV